MNGADFGTSELIYPENIIINGFHFPYPLNGTKKQYSLEDFDDERNYQNEIRNLPMLWKSIISGNRKL